VGTAGCGKTTLALLLARYADAEFKAISAVLSGLPEVREVLAEAEARFEGGRRTVLFVDEVHRFNKAQQDAFLPHIERGSIILRRRHHRESVVRTQLGLAVALPRARAGSADR
jgi:putative ATPase